VQQDEQQSIVFLALADQGFTKRLAKYCAAQSDRQASAWIEGSYGGVSQPIERLYDTLVLIAGGSGISACLPWFSFVVSQARQPSRVTRVVLMWVMKERKHVSWAETALREALKVDQNDVAVQVQLYVTGKGPVEDVLKVEERNETMEMKELTISFLSRARMLQWDF
jgi:hypothetical protein